MGRTRSLVSLRRRGPGGAAGRGLRRPGRPQPNQRRPTGGAPAAPTRPGGPHRPVPDGGGGRRPDRNSPATPPVPADAARWRFMSPPSTPRKGEGKVWGGLSHGAALGISFCPGATTGENDAVPVGAVKGRSLSAVFGCRGCIARLRRPQPPSPPSPPSNPDPLELR